MTKNYKKMNIKTLVVSTVAVLGLEALSIIVMARFTGNRMLLLGLTRLLQTGALVAVVLTLEGGLAAVGLERHALYRGLKKGLFWSAGFGIAALVALGLLSLVGVDVRTLLYNRLPAGRKNLLMFFMVGGLVAPVAEEVFFRGILYGFFRRWGVFIALVLSTGIFLLAHPMKGGIPVNQLVGGILFAVAYEAEGSLMVPIIIHCFGNLFVFTVSLVF